MHPAEGTPGSESDGQPTEELPRCLPLPLPLGLTFLGELPDKSLFASLVLGTRYRPLYVWTGAAAAFAVHMAIAVTAGQYMRPALNQAVRCHGPVVGSRQSRVPR